QSVWVLTAVTVVALPINLVSGLLGMNIGGIPFRGAQNGFWIVALLSLTLTSLSAWLIFRRRHN
ncbi:CorA family divalent cation transporter, partial [Enterobacter cloacae complex sp.6730515]